MKSTHKQMHARILVILALLLPGIQAFCWTPAGTEIRNQSVATYKDLNDQPQISTSNEVINIVAKKYGLEITPDYAVTGDAPFNYTAPPALTQTAAPGSIAYFHYYLKNTGNTPDAYNLIANFQAEDIGESRRAPDTVEVYYDANGNGQVDAGDILLYTRAGAVETPGDPTPLVAQDASIPLIVAVHIPTDAADGHHINTDIDAASIGSDPSDYIDAISNWNQTIISAGTGILTATKAANVSTAKPGDELTYTIEGSNTGTTPVYAVKYPNFIALDAASSFATYNEGILIIDELDPDKLQVDPNYNGSSGSYGYAGLLDAVVTANPKVSGPTKARILYWNENPEGWFETPGNATWGSDLNNKPKIALFIPDDNNGNDDIDLVLASSQGYKFSFNIKIRTPYADADNVIKNQVEVTYAKDSSGNEVIAESNESRVTVGTDPDTATPGVAIGPFTYPLADTEATFTNLSHPAITKTLTVETGSLDTTRAGIRDAGEVVAFPLSILNPNQDLTALGLNGTGGPATSADIYNITYSAPPAGYTIVLYKSDAITPLADTNGDGIPDTGAIEPGAQADIVVKVYIAASLNDSTAREFTITAQSTNAAAPAIIDTTTLHIQQVLPAGVDIATATPVSAGPPPTGQLGGNDNATDPNLASEADDDDHTTIAGVNPGTIVVFPVDIANMRPGTTDSTTSVADTYKLSVEKKLVNGKDAGPFIVELLEDIDNNKEVDANELVPISDTGWLAPVKKVDTVANVYADAERIFRLNVRVKVPEGTTAGNYIIAVKATSTNNPNVEDIMHLLVKVNEFPSIQVTPDNTATVVAGGTYIFSHVVVNTGNIADKVTMEYNIASTLSGYNAVWVNESGAILGDGSTYTTENNLDPNDSFNVYLKVFVPANAPAGSVVPITVTGTMDVNGTVYDTALDVLTVIDGALQLTKSNSPTGEIEPGKKITYTTVYKNLSPGELTDAYIADAIPANTYLDGSNLAEITATLPGASTSISVNSNAEDFEYILNGGSIWTPFDLGSLPDFTEVTNIRVKIGTVPAGEKGDFVFKVIVK